jgi:type I restriction-modification system DNA methylase subunit
MSRKNLKRVISEIGSGLKKIEKLYIINTFLLVRKENEGQDNWLELIKNIQDFRISFYEKVGDINGTVFSEEWIRKTSDVVLRNIMSLFVTGDLKNSVFMLYQELFENVEEYNYNSTIKTNPDLYQFISKGINFKNIKTIYDPAFGIGEGFISIFKNQDYQNLKFVGQEIDPLLWANMKTVFAIFDVSSDDLYNGDTLITPENVVEEEMQQYDLVIVDPPQNEKVEMAVFETDEHMRFKYGMSEKSEFAFLEHGVRATKENGITVAFINADALKRSGKEKIIRKNLIHDKIIDTIIQISKNLGEEDSILVLSSEKKEKKTLLIDFTEVAGPIAEDIIKLYQKPEIIDGITLLYDQKEFKNDDYILLPSYYIEKEVFKDVTDDIFNLKSRKNIAIESVAEISSGISTAVKKLTRTRDATHTNAISFVKSSDIENDGTILLKDEIVQWSEEGIRGIERTIFEEDDIVLLTRGGLNKIGIVKNLPKDRQLGAGMNTLKIRVNKELYSPHLLFELLKSKYGNYLMNRIILETRGLKRFMNIREFTHLKIPAFSNEERVAFDNAYKQVNEREKALRIELEEIKGQKSETLKAILDKK